MTPEIMEEARKLWLEGMGYRPMARFLNEKYPELDNLTHQSLMSLLSPKYAEEANRLKKERQAKLSEARKKEYTDSLKKLYGNKNKN